MGKINKSRFLHGNTHIKLYHIGTLPIYVTMFTIFLHQKNDELSQQINYFPNMF